MTGATHSIVAIRALLAVLVQRGIDVVPLLASAGIEEAALDDPDARVATSRAWALWKAAVRVTADPELGLHVAESTGQRSLDILGYITSSSRTIGDAVRRMCRYSRLLVDPLEIEVETEGEWTAVRYLRPRIAPRAVADYRVALLARSARLIANRELPGEVQFAHRRPKSTAEYERVFAAPAKFGCAHDAVVFPTALVELPLPGADEQLCSILERQAEQSLALLVQHGGIRDRVLRVMGDGLERGEISLHHVARQMRMSSRTLSRRLSEESTSHQQLLDELRRELALRYLNDDGRTVSEVAFLLGFADLSSLTKAFKRWTGTTPRQAATAAESFEATTTESREE